MPTIYPSLKIGAKRRLEIFRKEAAQTNWQRPMTWRDVRFATLKSDSGLSSGMNDGAHVWYTQDGEQFRNETDAHDVSYSGICHAGWFTDDECSDKVIGIVVSLPHGRFLAGYRSTSNDERVYFGEIFDSEEDAARMADEHARVIAESEQEYNARFRAAQKLETETEDALTRLRECIALRHKQCMSYVRDEARELVETIRTNRELLQTEFKGVL